MPAIAPPCCGANADSSVLLTARTTIFLLQTNDWIRLLPFADITQYAMLPYNMDLSRP